MKTSSITPLLLGLLFVPSCGGGSNGSAGNPKLLWLATDQTETRVKLTAVEPEPF